MKKKVVFAPLAVIVAFAAGLWFGAAYSSAGKVVAPPNQLIVNNWTGDVARLTRNQATGKLVDPAKVPLLVGWLLDQDSEMASREYDSLSATEKMKLARYASAARNIALAQKDAASPFDGRSRLLIFSRCLKKVSNDGGTMRDCARANGMSATARVLDAPDGPLSDRDPRAMAP
jgi:hypothetical protein